MMNTIQYNTIQYNIYTKIMQNKINELADDINITNFALEHFADVMNAFSMPKVPLLCKLMDNDDIRIHSKLDAAIYDYYINTSKKLDETGIKIPKLTKCPRCYLCGKKENIVHWFYHSLCRNCGNAAYTKRNMMADMTNKYAIVIGGRLKLGYQVALKLLRCGANVAITSRKWTNAADRYLCEYDYDVWKS